MLLTYVYIHIHIYISESVWGRSSLRLKELHQLRVGNVLMGFMLEIFTALFCVQGVAVIEHPAPPTRPTSVSIWRTSILELLLSLPGVELVQLAQGLLDAKSPKPTALLALNAPDLRDNLRKWQVSKDLPAAASIGLDSKGHWSTAALKEYPPALNGVSLRQLELAPAMTQSLSPLPFVQMHFHGPNGLWQVHRP